MSIEWSDDFVVGIAEVDEQHQALFAQINELMAAMRRASGKQAVEKTLSFLADYVVMHFANEETMMAKHKYPGLEAHKEQHQAFLRTFGELKQEFAKTGPTSVLAITINGRVGQWLVKHVLSTDQELGRFIRGRKTAAPPLPPRRG